MFEEVRGEAWYEKAEPSLLAQAPAQIKDLPWDPGHDWNDFRNYLETRLLGMRNWRTSWWQHWALLAANIMPRRYLWLVTANNMTRGLPINEDVVDSTPAQAVLVCAAGMMDGLISPTKIWFKIKTPAGIQLDTEAKYWIAEFQRLIYDVLAGSNWYDSIHQMFEDEIVFGTGPMIIYEHRDNVINCVNPCAGEYMLAAGPDQIINSLYREQTMTVQQIVQMYGPKSVSGTPVADQWNSKTQMELEHVVAHAIEPNYSATQYQQRSNLGVIPGNYAFREYYWLRNLSTPQPLSARGFEERPYIAPRWNLRSNDPYGRSPGMDALPDIRQLHQMTRRLAEAIEKMVRPPLLADVTMKNHPSSVLPGRVTYVPNLDKNTGMRPTYTVNPQVQEMDAMIGKLQQRVERWFFNDVFQMISQMEGIQPRNELEINERKGEKLLRLGPVVERNLREVSSALERVVSIMVRKGLVRPKPQSMRGVPIQIEFISKLALIQQAAETASMERVLAMAGQMEAAMPGTLDNINKDRYIRIYGKKLDAPPEMFNDQATIDQIRQSRDAAQQAALQSHEAKEVTPAITQAAKNLSDTDVGSGQNAIQALLGAPPSPAPAQG